MSGLPTLPKADDAPATLLSWYVFDDAMQDWVDVRLEPLPPSVSSASSADHPAANTASDLTLVTWNVDAFSPQSDDRLAGILAAIRSQPSAAAPGAATVPPTPPAATRAAGTATPDVLFLQEVSRSGLAYLVRDPWIRGHWYVSDIGAQADLAQGYSTFTMVSRRFPVAVAGHGGSRPAGVPVLGALWRVDFPSRFGRYAICCEIRMPGPAAAVVRLVNVHLDSLQFQPSQRPRQLQIVADMLYGRQTPSTTTATATATTASTAPLSGAAHGLVAGDFNPVLPEEDDLLVAANGLVDAWQYLHPSESGVTWGIDGKQQFPPARLDKVAVVGLEPRAMSLLHPGTVPLRQGNKPPTAAAAGGTATETGATAASTTAATTTTTAAAAAAAAAATAETATATTATATATETTTANPGEDSIPWSDHSGLWCTFRVAVAGQLQRGHRD